MRSGDGEHRAVKREWWDRRVTGLRSLESNAHRRVRAM